MVLPIFVLGALCYPDGVEKLISKILIVGRNPTNRKALISTLARTPTQIDFAADSDEAIAGIKSGNELPDMVIRNLEYDNSSEPLKLYQYLRANEETCEIPYLFVVETDFEVMQMRTMGLTNACVARAPLTFASFVYALPALGMTIKDTVLYKRVSSKIPEKMRC